VCDALDPWQFRKPDSLDMVSLENMIRATAWGDVSFAPLQLAVNKMQRLLSRVNEAKVSW